MADTPENLEPKILELLKKNGKMSLGELQKALGIKRPSYTNQNQHKMPLNQALIKLRDSGKISAPSKSFGDPIFEVKASMNKKLVASELLKIAKLLLKADKPVEVEHKGNKKKGIIIGWKGELAVVAWWNKEMKKYDKSKPTHEETSNLIEEKGDGFTTGQHGDNSY